MNTDDTNRQLLEATSRVALAGLLHDLGKLAQRADMPVPDTDTIEVNKQIYCPNPKPHPNSPGWFSHVHAAYTALALDAIEPDLPPIRGRDASPFQEYGEGRAGGADDSLINAAAKHHKPETFLQWIIATADRAASGLDREKFDRYNTASDENPTTGKNHYTTRQYTLFEQIDIGPETASAGPKSNWNFRYPLMPLSVESIFPELASHCESTDRPAARAEYAELWNGFREALKRIPKPHRANLPLWLDHFDALWMAFAHAVPSATAFGTVPDISLYDHSRVVAALSAALWRYHHDRQDDSEKVRTLLARRKDWDEQKFLFVQGDLFGIQDFIFAAGGETTKRAAKLLRGRSLYVTLLAECAALRVLDELALPPTSQIVNAAGKFQIIAPNTVDVIEKLRETRQRLDDWFLEHTFGQSGVGLAWTRASCNDLASGSKPDSGYRRLTRRLFGALDDVKLRRFDLCAGNSRPTVFDDYLRSIGKHGLCEIDGRSPADFGEFDDIKVSQLAADHIKIGNFLANSDRERLLISRRPINGPNVDSIVLLVFGFAVGFADGAAASGEFGRLAGGGELLRAWDISVPSADPRATLFQGYARRDVSGWIPRFTDDDISDASRYAGGATREPAVGIPEAEDIKTFEHLACEARGRDCRAGKAASEQAAWIGVRALMTLKGDVDNLGTIFQKGLNAPSLSRMASLSRQMNAFFAVYLPHLCRIEFPNTYTVFAGGDDFFLIGPWTQQMELASRLRDDFDRYVAGNREIGFSVGLAMTKPGRPVREIGEMAEDALDNAKNFQRASADAGTVARKNAVTCFGRTIEWSRYRMLLEARESLAAHVRDLSHGYTYDLLQLVDLVDGVKNRPENAVWRSRFYYRTARALENIPGLKAHDRRQRLETLAQTIAEQGIEHFGGDYRVALFSHLYRNRH